MPTAILLDRLSLQTKHELKSVVGRVRALSHRGNEHACCLCGGQFARWYRGRVSGRCPRCNAPARTRFLLHAIREAVRGFHHPPRVLHFAPEMWLRPHIRALVGQGYVSTDLERPDVDVNTSITELEFEDGAFELVVCSHVLEHIEDDAAAMAELFRVTSPGGATIVQVPLDFDATTDEDPSVREPAERLRRWGNASHVRMYGLDVVERLTNAGFVVTQLVPQSFLGTYQARRQGLDRAVTAFLCRRPS